MIQQIKSFKGNALAFEIIDGFTETDERLAQKFFQEKIDLGFEQINVLIKIDELKVDKVNINSFMEDILWLVRNYKKMGHIAIVAHSKIIKAFVPIDNLFFERASKNRIEKYFDAADLDKALAFISANE